MKSIKGPSVNDIISSWQAFVKDKFQNPAIPSPYTHIVIFGDELCDCGRWGEYTNMLFPPARYGFYKGRWSNGKVWIELLAEQLGISRSRMDNYAQGGATTGLYNVFKPLRQLLKVHRGTPIEGMLGQVDRYLKQNPRISKHTLFVLMAGMNDIRGSLINDKPDLEREPASENFQSAMKHLSDAGATDFLIGNCPDLSTVSEYSEKSRMTIVKNYCGELNAGIKTLINEYREQGATIRLLDFELLMEQVHDDPERYGFAYHDAYLPLEIINFDAPLDTPQIEYPHQENGLLPDQFIYWWSACPSAPLHKVMLNEAIKLFQEEK